jgi:hypothetical protein
MPVRWEAARVAAVLTFALRPTQITQGDWLLRVVAVVLVSPCRTQRVAQVVGLQVKTKLEELLHMAVPKLQVVREAAAQPQALLEVVEMQNGTEVPVEVEVDGGEVEVVALTIHHTMTMMMILVLEVLPTRNQVS